MNRALGLTTAWFASGAGVRLRDRHRHHDRAARLRGGEVPLVVAIVTADPEKVDGLDAALRAVGEQPFGQVLLVLTGAGIALCGLYSIGRARYGRMM